MTARTTTENGVATGGVHIPGLAACAAASLSLAAALIHLWVVPEHFVEWWGYGAFFLLCALAQGLFGVLVLRFPWSKVISLSGVAGNLAIVLLYVLTRTHGVPLGPHASQIEAVGALGVTATAVELGIVFALLTLLDGAYRKVVVNILLAVGVLLWVLRMTGVIV